jgi:probable HAF family extracellular repeat protein
MNRLIPIVLATLASAHAATAAPYSIVELGTLGEAPTFALDVNYLRQVSGNSTITAAEATSAGATGSRLRAFSWSAGAMSNLGVLPGATTNQFGRGYALNDSGVVVGEFNNDASRAFVYDPMVGSMVGLTRLAGDNDRGVAQDINNAGVIVGASSNGVATRATKWTFDGSAYIAEDLGSIDGSTGTSARANAINQNGAVAGFSRDASVGTSQATLWDGGSVIDLGSLGDGLRFSQAYGLNDNLTVVGSSSTGQTVGELIGTGSTTSITRAFAWEAGVMAELPPVNLYTPSNSGADTNYHSVANDVNNDGVVVGTSQRIFGLGGVATMWRDGLTIDLNTLIPAGSGWVLQNAQGINDRGDIVGFGTFGGSTRSFLLTIPEPGTGLLAALAFASLASGIWRR